MPNRAALRQRSLRGKFVLPLRRSRRLPSRTRLDRFLRMCRRHLDLREQRQLHALRRVMRSYVCDLRRRDPRRTGASRPDHLLQRHLGDVVRRLVDVYVCARQSVRIDMQYAAGLGPLHGRYRFDGLLDMRDGRSRAQWLRRRAQCLQRGFLTESLALAPSLAHWSEARRSPRRNQCAIDERNFVIADDAAAWRSRRPFQKQARSRPFQAARKPSIPALHSGTKARMDSVYPPRQVKSARNKPETPLQPLFFSASPCHLE